jgi:hypothetical protein
MIQKDYEYSDSTRKLIEGNGLFAQLDAMSKKK